eukprot:sb/3469812/
MPATGGNLGDKANIDSFGLSLTTLEEVFIKVGEEEPHETGVEGKKDEDDDPPPNNADNVVQFKVFKRAELYSGITLLMYQLLAMVDKRFINSKRYKKGIIVQILLPVIFSVLGLLTLKLAGSTDGSVEVIRPIDLNDYPGQGIEGSVFLSDLTDNKNYFTDKLDDYLKTVNLKTITDLTADIEQNIASYNSKTDTSTCCSETALQLVSKCAEKGNNIIPG